MTTDAAAPFTYDRRLQRTVDRLPVVHLEAADPGPAPAWVEVTGLVERPGRFDVDALRAIEDRFVIADHHCVWGWSRRTCRWRGATLGAVLDHVGVLPGARTVTVRCHLSEYASCLHMDDARAGTLAWGLDGAPLAPAHGGPLRFQNPEWLWAYKGVKWAGRIEVGTEFAPGFWESLVGDPEGRIPAAVLGQFAHWKRRRRP
jgi:DMSO/TMAO reductase YedYZ molybdopterin-dependent catalytic subunit